MRIIYLIFIFCLPFLGYGQKKYTLVYKNSSYKSFIKNPSTQFKDSTSAINYASELQNSAISKGYLLASVDSIFYESNKSAIIDFSLGPKFNGSELSIDKKELEFIRKYERINEKLISNLEFTPREVRALLSKIHSAYLNNGYPFVAIQLSNHQIINNVLKADIKIEKGKIKTWQNIHIRGDSSVSEKFVSSLLDIKVGALFDESKLKTISDRIAQIPFLQEIKAHEILYTKEGCELYLYLKSIPISSFNGIVGLQPDPATEKITITGELNLKLLNLLKRGELLDIRWQSIRDKTQSLKSHLNYPFLFNTSFGIDGTFDLYKRDTSFLELNSKIGVQYFLKRGNYLKAFYQNLSSEILEGGLNNPTFSKLGSVSSNNYGLSYVSTRVDYLPNPTRGFNLTITASAGNRKSQINDSAQVIKSGTFRGVVDAEYFIPLHKRHILRINNVTEFYSADAIFENELFRFGGLDEQRGFNEDELFATTRSTTVLEYRFLLDRNSHVFAFADQTWYENNVSNYYNDTPFGFGAGFSFRTNLGVFSISYALGKQLNNPILLSNGKIHFGYIAYF